MASEFDKGSLLQFNYNEIKGVVFELNDDVSFCSISLNIGYDNTRSVNVVCKKSQWEEFSKNLKTGDKVAIKFYIVSNHKHNRWYTSARILAVENITRNG